MGVSLECLGNDVRKAHTGSPDLSGVREFRLRCLDPDPPSFLSLIVDGVAGWWRRVRNRNTPSQVDRSAECPYEIPGPSQLPIRLSKN